MTSEDAANQGAKQEKSPSTGTTAPRGVPAPEAKPLEIRWRVVVPVVLIGAVVLLTALPLGTVWIVSNSGCCLGDGMEQVATFWGSLTAGFLALFGMLVTGVFIITAFRTDVTARAEARDAVAKYIEREKEKFFEELQSFQCEVKAGTEQVKDCVKKINDATATASKEIEGARKRVETAADKATKEIDTKLSDVEDQSKEATKAIGRAQERVEDAATAAHERISQATRDLPPPPERSPD